MALRQKGRHSRPSVPARTASAVGSTIPAAAVGTAVVAAVLSGHPAAKPEPVRIPAAQETAFFVPAVHPAVTAAQIPYTVMPGDSLSGIAQARCGTPADWTGIYGGNKGTIGADPDLIYPGQRLALDCVSRTMNTVATVSFSVPAAGHPSGSYGHPYYCGDGDGDGYDIPCAHSSPAQPSRAYTQAVTDSTYHGSGAMQQCIISRESGGNSQVMNSSSHYGLYQFSYSTWVGHGGSAADFGHASVAEQNRVYYSTVAADGYSDWQPYDGCTP